MTQLKINTIANFVGRAFTATVGIIFVPLYVKYLGIESYGLVTFYTTLLSVFGLINSSLGATLTRELAVLTGVEGKNQQQRDFLRTLEVIFWGLSILVGVIVLLLSPLIANHWVQRETLSAQTVEDAVRYMGLVIAFEFISSFYQGGLIGVQRQVLLNVIRVLAAALRSIGVVAVLAWVSPTIQAFFLWSLGASAVQAAASGLCLWLSMPSSPQRSAFRTYLLKGVWRYTAGIIGINITVLLLTQLDKAILSKYRVLGILGYYGLAGVAASALQMFIQPLQQAVFPRMSQLVGQGDRIELSRLYHYSSQLMSVIVMPAALVVAFFSRQAMFIWTGDPVIADHTSAILAIVIVGTSLNGLFNIPYSLQLASGWTRLIFVFNIATAACLIPTLMITVKQWGGIGAACAWVGLNALPLLVQVPIMHRRLLRGEMWRWYIRDIAPPVAGIVAVCFILWKFVPENLSRMAGVMWLGGVWICATLAGAALAPEVRGRAVDMLRGALGARRPGT